MPKTTRLLSNSPLGNSNHQPAGRKLASRHAAGMAITCLLLTGCSGADNPLKPGQERSGDREAQQTAQMIEAIKDVSQRRAAEEGMAKRFNQVKTLGCFDANFSITKNLPLELRQGIFAQENEYPAQLRFANASESDDTEKDFRGLSIKLKGVSGVPLWGVEGEQDFLLNSHPVLFAADPADFLDFIEATRKERRWQYFLNPAHFYSLLVVLKGREKISNPFAIRYWSTTPYRFGSDESRAVKYSVRPCDGTVPDIKVKAHSDFLTDAMHAHLQATPACFDFMVQFQTDPVAMPIENAAVLWSEAESPFIKVANITIEPGDTSAATRTNCEAMTFNPWQSLEAHRPLGGINRTRLAIYSEIGKFRQEENARR